MKATFKIISGEDLKNEIDIIDYMGDLCDNSLYVGKVIFIDGDLEVDGDFTFKKVTELDSVADFMLIKGNLVVNGDMNPLEETFPNILVLGDMFANNIQSGEELLMVNGNVSVKNMLSGSYSHGGLKVNGTVTAKYIINNEHMMLLPNVKANYVINPIDDLDDIDVEYDPLPYNYFKKDLLEKLESEYLTQIASWDWDANVPVNKVMVDVEKLVVAIKQEIKFFKN